jgi:hypothetical protein
VGSHYQGLSLEGFLRVFPELKVRAPLTLGRLWLFLKDVHSLQRLSVDVQQATFRAFDSSGTGLVDLRDLCRGIAV